LRIGGQSESAPIRVPGACERCRMAWLHCAPTRRFVVASSRAVGGRWRKDRRAGWPRCDLQHSINTSLSHIHVTPILNCCGHWTTFRNLK